MRPPRRVLRAFLRLYCPLDISYPQPNTPRQLREEIMRW